MSRAGLLPLALALLGSACESGVNLRGDVEVSVEVQQQFSSDRPGVLWIGGRFGDHGSFGDKLLFVLCDPTSDPVVVPFHLFEFGCAGEGTARVVVSRVAPKDREKLTCGIHEHDPYNFILFDSQKEVVASAKVPIFKGEGGWGCGNADETIHVKLTAGP